MKALEVIIFLLAALYVLFELHAIPVLRAEACNITVYASSGVGTCHHVSCHCGSYQFLYIVCAPASSRSSASH